MTFQAAPGETNELRMVPDPDGVRIVDSGPEIVPGAFCTRPGPRTTLPTRAITLSDPSPVSAVASRPSRAGGPQQASLGVTTVIGGPGADRIEAGRGDDTIAGGSGRDDISAGAGDDFVRASGPDRDVVRCARGRDRVFIARRDRVFGCERITPGWDGRVVYPSALVSRLSSLQLLLLLPPRGE